MARILVVYYSRSGTTRAVGEAIAKALECPAEAIVEPRSRAGILGYLRSGNDATFRRTVEIEPPAYDPSAYDLVLVGTPVWRMSVSSPARSYLAKHRRQLRKVAFFCTEGWFGGARAFRQMAEICRQQPLAVLELSQRQVRSQAHLPRVQRFADQLRRAIAMPRRA